MTICANHGTLNMQRDKAMTFKTGDIVELVVTDFLNTVDSDLAEKVEGRIFVVKEVGKTLRGTPNDLRAIVVPYRSLVGKIGSSPIVTATDESNEIEIPISMLRPAHAFVAAKNRKNKND